MVNIIQKQADTVARLRQYAALQYVNVTNQRTMQLRSEVNMAVLYTKPRNGKAGTGILVEMPLPNCETPNVSGPVLDWLMPVVVVEQPAASFSPDGPNLNAEDIMQLVLDCLHLTADDETGTLVVTRKPVEVVTTFPGCLAYRVFFSFKAAGREKQTAMAAQPVASASGGVLTLSTTEAGGAMWFTLDGGAPSSANDGSEGPNLVPAGAVYDGGGSYTVGAPVAFRPYWYEAGVNEASALNVSDALTSGQQFTMGDGNLVLTGVPGAPVTAFVGAAAMQYSGPVTGLAAGTKVRACTEVAGKRPSATTYLLTQ